MKVRNGFVSNSSSSSFVIVGKEIDKEDIVNYLTDDQVNELQEIVDNSNGDYSTIDNLLNNEGYNPDYILQKNKLEFDVFSHYEYDTSVIGIGIMDIIDGPAKDVRQFMKDVDSAIAKLSSLGWKEEDIKMVGFYNYG